MTRPDRFSDVAGAAAGRMLGNTGVFPTGSGFYLLLGVGALCLLLGTLPMLAAIGLVDGSEADGVLGAVFAFVFGLVFAGLGAVAWYFAFAPIARKHGARTVATTARLALRALVRRSNRESLLAALGVALLATGFWAASAGVTLPLLGRPEDLMSAFVLEFMIIHGFVFLVVAATFVNRGGRARFLGGVALVALLALYSFVAWHTAGGLLGVGWLVYLLAPNVLAFARDPGDRSARVLAVSRWVVKFCLFVVLAVMLGGEGDIDGIDSMPLATTYFTVLVFVELWRISEVPVDLAHEWAAGRFGRTQTG